MHLCLCSVAYPPSITCPGCCGHGPILRLDTEAGVMLRVTRGVGIPLALNTVEAGNQRLCVSRQSHIPELFGEQHVLEEHPGFVSLRRNGFDLHEKIPAASHRISDR